MKTVRFGLIGMGIHGMRYARHIMRDIEAQNSMPFVGKTRHVGRRLPVSTTCGIIANIWTY